MVEIQPCYNEIRLVFDKQSRRIHEIEEGTVVAKHDGRSFWQLSAKVLLLQADTPQPKICAQRTVECGKQKAVWLTDSRLGRIGLLFGLSLFCWHGRHPFTDILYTV